MLSLTRSKLASLVITLDTESPNGYQLEQVHILHQHSSSDLTSDEPNKMRKFTTKISNVVANNDTTFSNSLFSGTIPTYQSGVDFWNRYYRILYNVQTAHRKPLLSSIPLSDYVTLDSCGFRIEYVEEFFARFNNHVITSSEEIFPLNQYFQVPHMTPFYTRLVAEKIEYISSSQYGYSNIIPINNFFGDQVNAGVVDNFNHACFGNHTIKMVI